ncbi:MAG: hypothetical protein M3R68_07225 [Acidobacteriota bacterium]|nr:hypothetical protein [Acidobacteriota bacterium]
MKLITRSVFALLFVLALAASSRAQNPNIAVKLDAHKNCVRIELKNLTTATIGVSYIELWVYDGKTCKRICATRKVINKKIKACDTLKELELCCSDLPNASEYIYYVRIHHSAGINEAWAFAP